MAQTLPPQHRIVVATHHKAGTVYCLRVFGEICRELGWGFWDMETAVKPEPWHIAFHGNATPERLRPALGEGCRLLHVVRHPKSLIVSGARYHLDAEEAWLDQPRTELGGRSYRQVLTGKASTEERIRFEMTHKSRETIAEMVGLESARLGVARDTVKLEDLCRDSSRRTYGDILSFLGIESESRSRAMDRFVRHALWSMEAPPAHARGGMSDDWRELFDAELDAEFERLFGDAEVVLGYRRGPFPTAGVAPVRGAHRLVANRPVIWLRVPKCAGTSTIRALENDGLLSLEGPEVGKVFVIERGEFAQVRERFPTGFARASKFAVVRNPWDRFISGWKYVAAEMPLRDLLRNLPGPDDFHRWHHVARTQWEFLVDENGRLMPDHLVRFERLQEGMDDCCKRVGLPRIVLPHENRQQRRDYRYYYDDETRRMVGELFRRDVEMFGYEY